MTRFRYHAEVLAQLASHGVRPKPTTPPGLVHEFVSDLYRFELRRLRDRLVRGEIPKAGYVDRVVALRRRYPLVSLKPEDLLEGSRWWQPAIIADMSRVRAVHTKLPSSGVSIFAVMTRLANEVGAINLSQGFPEFNPPPRLVDAVSRFMRDGHNQYAPMPGVQSLREALSAKIERLYGRRYDPATEITITAGSTEGLFATITALVHPGDEVLLFQPAYDSYTPAVALSGGTPVYATLRYPEYRIDWDEVRRKVSSRTRAIVINTPHNPTGTIWTSDDMGELGRVLQHSDAVVIADEVYEHILFDGSRHESLARYPDIADRAVVISSFAKTYHATGWKVGYCAAPAALTAEIQGVHQWITFAVNTPIQMAYAEEVRLDPECRELTAFYQLRRDRFLELIRGSRFRPLACQGTFFQMLDYSAITRETDTEFAIRLTREHGVAAIPISPFLYGGETAGPVLRFCFAKRDDTLERAAERLVRC